MSSPLPLVASLIASAALMGCASSPPPADLKGSFRERAVARVKESVVVTASVVDH
jgi:hypothetical protein